MPNTLALIGDSIKSTATAIVPRLSFGANQARGAITYGGFMGNALIQTANFGAPGAAQAGYDYDALLTDPMQNSVVAACVDVITRAIAEAPLILETKKGAEWERVESHPALDLFRANSHLSDSEIWGVTAAHKATRGLGYWVVFYNEAKTKPVELWPWAPEKVRAVSDSKEFIGEYEVQDEAGEWRTLPAKQVIQFRHLPNLRDLRGGWCPLSSGQVQMVGDNAVSTYNTAILLNAGVMSLLISIKAGEAQGRSIEVTPGQFQEWIDRLRRKHIGNKASAGGIEGTTLPLEVTKMAFSPDEMSVEKLEGIFMTRLHSLLGVSPKLTGMGPDATYLNQAEAINDFWERRIVPERNKDADTLNRQLLPLLDLDGDKWRFRFDFSNVAALQENTDGLFTRWRGLFKDGGCDLYTLQTKLGFTDVPDAFKGRFAGGGGGDAAAADEAAAVKALWELKKYDPRQPRNDLGQWSDGAGGISVGHAVHVMKSEGIMEHHQKWVTAAIENGTHKTREQVLAHIDAIHKGNKETPAAGDSFHSYASFDEAESANHLAPMFALIASVHAIPEVGKFSVSGKSSMGGGSYNCRTSEVGVNFLGNSDPQFGARLSFVHELGHLVDHRVLSGGDPGDPGSGGMPTGFATERDRSPELQSFFEEIYKTPSHKSLGEGRTNLAYRGYLKYPHEVWARAYVQYIATRSNDASLLSEVHKSNKRPAKGGKGFVPLQWNDEEFEPVARAMDAIFAKEGLLKK